MDATTSFNKSNNPRNAQSDSDPLSQLPPPLEPSWINAEPVDEFVRDIGDFIASHAKGRSHIEVKIQVEAKIGRIIDTRTNQRLALPVRSETILNISGVRFESNMTLEQHAHYNRLLNGRVETTNSSNYPHAKIGYSHTRVVDSFHPSPSPRPNSKLRLTRDERTGAVQECVIKERLGNIDIFCPRHNVDWRISVNVEIPVDPPETAVEYTRRKDRLTYTHQAFRIDLTQVNGGEQDPSKLGHELEVEFRDAVELTRLATIKETQPESGWVYDEIIHVFVNNVRILVRNAL
ncbi:mRNA capping enzyme [Clavulina sp. PMI_390]|nr:mRNA capping enzyme [Clavulina sp. PMI_390]